MLAKVVTYILVSVHLAGVLASKDTEDVLDLWARAKSEYIEKGPSLKVLQGYDSVIPSMMQSDDDAVREMIPAALYERGTINYALDRDMPALEDFNLCMDTSVKFNDQCFTNLAKICLNYGYKDRLEACIEKHSVPKKVKKEVLGKIGEISKLEKALDLDDPNKCVLQAEQLLGLSEHNIIARRAHAKCLESVNIPFTEKLGNLTADYTELAERDNLSDYSKLALLYLFGQQSSIVMASRSVKACLKMDNENPECRKMSKIVLKLSKPVSAINAIQNYYSVVYGDISAEELYRVSELEPDRAQFEEIKRQLLDTKVSFRSNDKDILGFDVTSSKNNLDVISEYMLIALKEQFGIEKQDALEHSVFMHDLMTMAKECYLQTDDWGHARKAVLDDKWYKEYSGTRDTSKDGPDEAVRLDKMLKHNKFKLAKKEFESMTQQMKRTKLIKKRYDAYKSEVKEKEEARQRQKDQQQKMNEQRQRQQWQRQQQQEQQYRQQQYRQQQQQQQQAQYDPKKDLYKVLGVSKNADEAAIKKAYREKMKQNHPDKLKRSSNLTEEEIEAKVAEINNAYEVLSDKDERANYDNSRNPNMGAGAQYQQPGQNVHQFFGNGNQFNFGDFGRMFAQQGGGGGSFNFRQPPQPRQGQRRRKARKGRQ